MFLIYILEIVTLYLIAQSTDPYTLLTCIILILLINFITEKIKDMDS